MAGINIRPTTVADIEAVLEVFESVAAEGRWIGAEAPIDRTGRAERLRAGLADPATFVAFVAEVDRRVVGTIDGRLAHYGVIEIGMAVLEGHRGRRIGTRLLDAAVSASLDLGAHKVALQVWPHNDAAIALYRKAGFVEEGRLRRHYRRRNGDLWDALVMGLLLPDEQGAGP